MRALTIRITSNASSCAGPGTHRPGVLKYCLFVPRSLLKSAKTSDVAQLLKRLPLARLHGDGEFNSMLDKVAEQQQIELNTRLTCSSFPSIKEAVKRRHIAAVLPTIAEADLPSREFAKFTIPLPNTLNRNFVLCFNKRLVSIRPQLERALSQLASLFAMP